MKLFIIIFIIISFVGVSVFGYLGMLNGTMHGYVKCIASLFKRVSCSSEVDTLTLEVVHMNIYKSFSEAILFVFLFIINIFLLSALLFLENITQGAEALFARARLYYLYFARIFIHSFFRKFIFWIALHEKEDAVFSL